MTDVTNTNAARAAALAMRDAAAALARRRPLYDGASGEPADEDLAQAIEDLPLPDADTTDWKAEAERLRGELTTLAEMSESRRSEMAAVISLNEHMVDAVRRERDELAARLAKIEAQETVAWIEHELQGTGLRHLHFARRPNMLRDDVVAPVWTALIARPAPATVPERADYSRIELAALVATAEAGRLVPAAPCDAMYSTWAQERLDEGKRAFLAAFPPGRAEPGDGCGACGDSCRSRGSCRLADESPKPAARPCRCGPDGCSDSTSCPRGER